MKLYTRGQVARRFLYGTAFGYYGTKIAVKTRYLKNYKRKSKFANFINKWYEKVWEVLQ
jgi:hypothetical protein